MRLLDTLRLLGTLKYLLMYLLNVSKYLVIHFGNYVYLGGNTSNLVLQAQRYISRNFKLVTTYTMQCRRK